MMAETEGDASRLLLSRLVMDHRLRPKDPMSLDDVETESKAAELLLDVGKPDLDQARAALSA